MERIIFHVDVNSAFLSWEAVHRLTKLNETVDLRTIPSAIGGDEKKRHGVILAKSTPAKAFHVKTGEPIVDAKKKCPGLLLIPPRFEIYHEFSQSLMKLLSEYTPDVEQYSIDEAFMDMTGTKKLWGDPLTAAHTIKDRIERELGFTVNIGISVNKLLAKMASDFKKPNLVHTLFPDEIKEKMWPLPVSDLFFVGKSSASTLNALGITTIGELARTDLAVLQHHLKSHGEVIWHYANGREHVILDHSEANKGYGNSTTVPFDICNEDEAHLVLLSLAETVGMRLRKDHVKISTISVTIKTFDLKSCSHQRILSNPTDITNEIYHTACELFSELWDYQTPIRLLGIQTSRIDTSEIRQISLEDCFSELNPPAPNHEKLTKADHMADTIRNRFGMDSVKRASFISDTKVEAMSGGLSKAKLKKGTKNPNSKRR